MANRAAKRQPALPASASTRRWPGWLPTAVVLAGVGAAVAYGYHYLAQPGRLPLRVIEVKGEFRHLVAAEIQETVVDAIDGGFFSCDMPRLRSAVLAMPWVADVSVRRVWPDTLSMRVSEEVPLARWGDGALINAAAGVFAPPALGDYTDLARLGGPAGSERRVVEFYQAVVAAADARQLQVAEVLLDERRHWWVTFDDGLVLSLGRDDIAHRLAQFIRVYPSLVAQPQRRPQRIDMRYAHGFAVRWRDPVGGDAVVDEEQSQDKV